jgi:hypothetical protein
MPTVKKLNISCIVAPAYALLKFSLFVFLIIKI